jgi:hypothetical protein
MNLVLALEAIRTRANPTATGLAHMQCSCAVRDGMPMWAARLPNLCDVVALVERAKSHLSGTTSIYVCTYVCLSWSSSSLYSTKPTRPQQSRRLWKREALSLSTSWSGEWIAARLELDRSRSRRPQYAYERGSWRVPPLADSCRQAIRTCVFPSVLLSVLLPYPCLLPN